jgi:hypothetical protein
LESAPLVEIIDRVVISNMIVNNLDFLSQLLSGGSLLQYLDVILLQFAMLLLQHNHVLVLFSVLPQDLITSFEPLHDFLLPLLLHVLFVLQALGHLLVPLIFSCLEVRIQSFELFVFSAQTLLFFRLFGLPFLDGALVGVSFGLKELLAVHGDRFVALS